MKKKRLLFVLSAAVMALCLLCAGAYADETSLRLGGSVRNFFTSDEDTTAVLSLLRLKAFMERGSITGELAYEITPRYISPEVAALPAVTASTAYRIDDLNETVYDTDRFEVMQNLDRASVTVSTSFSDISVGRQPVAFGAARIVNPTDVIAPFTYSTIATEERPGVDALRMRIPTGTMGEIDAGVVFGGEMITKKSAAFLRLKSYVLMTDVSLIGMSFRENTMMGASLARSIGGASAWAEAAHTIADSTDDYTRLSLGAEYKFTDKFYSYLEYHLSGAGEGQAEDYDDVFEMTLKTAGAVYLLGRHYAAPGLVYEVTPLVTFSASALVNLNDGSALASPAFSISLADDVTMKLGSFLIIGSEDDTEFGRYPNVFYAGLNAYF